MIFAIDDSKSIQDCPLKEIRYQIPTALLTVMKQYFTPPLYVPAIEPGRIPSAHVVRVPLLGSSEPESLIPVRRADEITGDQLAALTEDQLANGTFTPVFPYIENMDIENTGEFSRKIIIFLTDGSFRIDVEGENPDELANRLQSEAEQALAQLAGDTDLHAVLFCPEQLHPDDNEWWAGRESTGQAMVYRLADNNGSGPGSYTYLSGDTVIAQLWQRAMQGVLPQTASGESWGGMFLASPNSYIELWGENLQPKTYPCTTNNNRCVSQLLPPLTTGIVAGVVHVSGEPDSSRVEFDGSRGVSESEFPIGFFGTAGWDERLRPVNDCARHEMRYYPHFRDHNDILPIFFWWRAASSIRSAVEMQPQTIYYGVESVERVIAATITIRLDAIDTGTSTPPGTLVGFDLDDWAPCYQANLVVDDEYFGSRPLTNMELLNDFTGRIEWDIADRFVNNPPHNRENNVRISIDYIGEDWIAGDPDATHTTTLTVNYVPGFVGDRYAPCKPSVQGDEYQCSFVLRYAAGQFHPGLESNAYLPTVSFTNAPQNPNTACPNNEYQVPYDGAQLKILPEGDDHPAPIGTETEYLIAIDAEMVNDCRPQQIEFKWNNSIGPYPLPAWRCQTLLGEPSTEQSEPCMSAGNEH